MSGDPAALAEAGLRLQQAGRLEAAEAHYRQALDLDPGHFTALLLCGELQRGRGQAQAAADLLERALEVNPGSAAGHAGLGLALHQLGRPEEALAHLGRALMLRPDAPEILVNRGILLRELGRPEAALASLDRALAVDPDRIEALLNRSAALLDLGRAEAALAGCALALSRRPDLPEALLLHGHALMDLGRPREALESYTRGLDLGPDQPELLLSQGNALLALGSAEQALASYDRLLALHPERADAHYDRGNALDRLGRDGAALAAYDRALDLEPGRVDALVNRARVLFRRGRLEAALDSYDRALALQPGLAEAWTSRGMALHALGRDEAALASYDQALERAPGDALAWNHRGAACHALGRLEEALDCYDRTLALGPDQADAWESRGTTLHGLRRNPEALASFERALAIRPDSATAASSRIFVLDFIPGLDFQEHQRARRAFWSAREAGPGPEARGRHGNDPDPARRLVLGYVSADFRHHSAAFAFGAVLRRHDRNRFRVVCYSGVRNEDQVTRDFRARADAWRAVADLDDAALAEQIRADGIDILIDLSAHSVGNRLPVFARKPAPVQVTAWGYGGGTGLAAMDYQFTDPVHIPAQARPLFAETCWDLPCCLNYEAPAGCPAVGEAPVQARGGLTFGCLNRFSKISPDALALWARILEAVPGARLLLKDAALDDPALCRQFLEQAARCGLAADRLELRGATSQLEHLATYGEVDLVLDSFPNSGGITTWEALWMGVPVLTLLGSSPGARVSAAILHALGWGEWVAARETDYLDLALRRAADPDGLARFRTGAREAILGTAAGDPVRYVRAVEAAYGAMWRRWASGGPR